VVLAGNKKVKLDAKYDAKLLTPRPVATLISLIGNGTTRARKH